MKKLFVVSFVVAFFFLMSTSIWAKNDIEPISLQTIHVSDIPLSSQANKNNLISLSDDLEQIVLSTNKNGEVWTVGFFVPENEILTYNNLILRLEEFIYQLDTKQHFYPDDFFICYYQASSLETTISELQGVEEIITEKNEANLSNNSENINDSSFISSLPEIISMENSLSSNSENQIYTIDGSHYIHRAIGSTVQSYWYNQITGETIAINQTPTSPYGGDGNNRTDSGYQWFPSYVEVDTNHLNQWMRTNVSLRFIFTEEEINNLNHDDNEALEMEVLFYNYAHDEDIRDDEGNIIEENRGVSFVPVKSNPILFANDEYDYTKPYFWAININDDSCYFDTAFQDNEEIISACIGISDTSSLVANQGYRWSIQYQGISVKQGYANDGRFVVQAQRSYLTDLPYTLPFRVFSEEKEQMIRYGISENQNWVGAEHNAFDNYEWICDLNNGGIWSQK